MMEKLLKLDMRKWLQLLSELDLLPVVFGQDWRFLWLQQISGTVTIVPSAPLSAYFRMISDPSYETMREYIEIGEHCTWTKLARISNHYRLERLLNDCRRMLDHQVEDARRLSLQREVRQIVREQKQKERWSSEEGEEDDSVGKISARDARAEEEEVKGDDESMAVEKIGYMDTSHPMRRASLAQQSRQIERALKARVVKEQLEQVKLGGATPPRKGRESGRFQWSGGDGVSETEKVEPGQAAEAAAGAGLEGATPVDPAPPIVFDEEGQAYLTDEGADTDDDDAGPPASPFRNM